MAELEPQITVNKRIAKVRRFVARRSFVTHYYIRFSMNSIIILPTECVDQSRATLQNRRADYAFSTHELRQGQVVKVAVLGGRRGLATVTSSTPTAVELALSLEHEPLDRKSIDLIVGLSRPQTVKKVIQAAVMLGVRSLHFVLSERGEKSYRTSHALQAEKIEEETIKALEQIWDSMAPSVQVHFSLRRVFEVLAHSSSDEPQALKLLADPSGVSLVTLGVANLAGAHSVTAPTVLAVGPERGWSAAEVAEFSSHGFTAITLGERVLRVELALVFLLGQLEMLQKTTLVAGVR